MSERDLVEELIRSSNKLYLSKRELDDVRNKYRAVEKPDRTIRHLYLSWTKELVDAAVENGVTKAEARTIALFAYVVLDAEKHFLDILKAKEDLGIDKLYTKYVVAHK